MDHVLGATSDVALTRAVEANLTSFHVFLSEWPEIELHRATDRLWTVSQRRFSLCNVILEARFHPTDVDAQIAQTLAPYAATHVNVMWKLGPSSRPEDLGDRLESYGFVARPTLRGMALDLTSFAPHSVPVPGLRILEVDNPHTLDLWRRAVDRGFGWPSYGAQDVADNLRYFFGPGRERPFVGYVGVIGEDPVASSLVFFGAGVAGLYHISTVAEHRRRGVGSAITRAPLAEARQRGYRVAVLHATEMGYPVYRGIGFQDVCAIAMRLRLT